MAGISFADILNAKAVVDNILEMNGLTLDSTMSGIYSSSPETGYGIYVNPTVKSISIHSPLSKRWTLSAKVKHPLVVPPDPHVFAPSSSKSQKTLQRTGDLWIGGFKDFACAYTYADLLRRAIYKQTGNEVVISGGKKTGIRYPANAQLF